MPIPPPRPPPLGPPKLVPDELGNLVLPQLPPCDPDGPEPHIGQYYPGIQYGQPPPLWPKPLGIELEDIGGCLPNWLPMEGGPPPNYYIGPPDEYGPEG